MNNTGLRRLADLWKADLFSPKDLVRRAAVVAGLYWAAELAGLREFTSIINGTMGSVELGWRLSGFLGLAYLAVYLAFVLLAPMLLLAAAMLEGWKRIRRGR